MTDDQPTSSYLSYLPAVFQEDPFLGRFLQAFEAILSGTGDPDKPGLEEMIEGIAHYFDPLETEPDFLPWLSNWVALHLRADWDEDTQRRFIRQIVPLYRLRGTRAGLRRMLELYTRQPVTIKDTFDQLPHFFQVRLTLSEPDPVLLRQKQQIARAIIEQEKPAHTFYALQIAVPTMRLVSLALQQQEKTEKGNEPALLILGKNTLLGTENKSP